MAKKKIDLQSLCVHARQGEPKAGTFKKNNICTIGGLIIRDSHCVCAGVQTKLKSSLAFLLLNLFDSPFVYVQERKKKKKKRDGERSGILLDGLTHIQAHLHAVPGMMRQRLGQTGHTVVTIAQDLDSHTFIFLKEKSRIFISRLSRSKMLTSKNLSLKMCYIYKLSLMFNTKPKHHKKTWKKLITYSQPLHTQSHPSGKKKKKKLIHPLRQRISWGSSCGMCNSSSFGQVYVTAAKRGMWTKLRDRTWFSFEEPKERGTQWTVRYTLTSPHWSTKCFREAPALRPTVAEIHRKH